jgi:rSAM/selenodomain-associated transferase 2
VIVPTLNEAQTLAQTLAAIRTATPVDIILVDGGSEDETTYIAKTFQVNVISAPPGRAGQMNRGARAATGDILLFLHADTCLPNHWDNWVRQTLNQPGVVGGAFNLRINGKGLGLRLVEWGVGVRSRLFQMPYGDQAIFLTATVFHELGGFPELPIMEDFKLIRQLKRQGTVAIAPAVVTTSSRRWRRFGVLRTTVINQVVVIGYLLRVSPQILFRLYHSWGRRRS